MTTQQFIERARIIHGDKYDYSRTEFIDWHTKVCIICHKKDKNGIEHGEFWQMPEKHIGKRKQGCKKCANEQNGINKRLTKEEFIHKANKKHNGKYDYKLVQYVDYNKAKVDIICEKHGVFRQTPSNHIRGQGCPYCVLEQFSSLNKDDTKSFISKAKKKYANYPFSYEKVDYVNSYTPVTITCEKHGDFSVKPNNFLQGSYCHQCKMENYLRNKRVSFDEFVRRAKVVHGDRYIYNQDSYVELTSDVRITCPEHGEFWQLASSHLQGKGCPDCNESHLERSVRMKLTELNVEFISQHSPEWLKNGRGKQKIDFFLPSYNIGIECQGEQHFRETSIYAKHFQKGLGRDKRKLELCKNNGVKLFYYTYVTNVKTFLGEKLYTGIDEMIEDIMNDN